MTRLVLASQLADDLSRVAEHLHAHATADIEERLAEIADAFELLTRHPLIGRKVANQRRELVIGRGARGYVALYAYDDHEDVVVIAALRAQREAGFEGP